MDNGESQVDTVRKALTNLTNLVFSSNMSNYSYNHFEEPLPGNKIVTNLGLQMCLYFNVYFFPFWVLTFGVMLDVKYVYLQDTYKVVLIAVLILFTAVESIRLYLGYLGNLQEKVPELAGFLLLTITLQTPLIFFLLLDPQTIRLPLEGAMNVIFALMILLEVIFGFITVAAMNRQQATKFHLHGMFQFDTISNDVIDDVDAHEQTGTDVRLRSKKR